MNCPLVIPDSAIPFILFQRTAYQSFPRNRLLRLIRKVVPFLTYERMVRLEASMCRERVKPLHHADMRDEYLSIREHLPTSCSNILDIGCGVAGIDAFIHRHYGGECVHFFLLDKSKTEKKVYYEFERRGAFYNSLSVARDLLVLNGVAEGNVTLLEATDANDIRIEREIDLAISLISWGFHYPVSTYLSQVCDVLSENGVLILDVRKNTDGIALLNERFSNVATISARPSYDRILCRR